MGGGFINRRVWQETQSGADRAVDRASRTKKRFG
jgi:hypothetical protein